MTDGEHGLVGALPASPPPNIVGCKILLQEFTHTHDPDSWDYRPRYLKISKYRVVSGPRPILTSTWSALEQCFQVEKEKWSEIMGDHYHLP